MGELTVFRQSGR